jgi:hypothetical protein
MYLSEIKSQLDRVNRMLRQKLEQETLPMTYILTREINQKGFLDIETTEAIDPQIIDDLARNLLIQTYHIKDRIVVNPNLKKLVESEINNDTTLAVCADLANWAKHGKLNKSRSGKFPHIQGGRTLHKEFVQDAKSEQWIATKGEVFANVCDNQGEYLGDAFEIVEYTLKKFEAYTDSVSEF